MIQLREIKAQEVTIIWDNFGLEKNYEIFWSDKNLSTSTFVSVGKTSENEFTLKKATHVPHYLKVVSGKEETEVFTTPVHFKQSPQLENLGRGLVALLVDNGVFLTWRLLKHEVFGFNQEKQTLLGKNFQVFKNGKLLATITDSTNFLDETGSKDDSYEVAVENGEKSPEVKVVPGNFLEIPLKRPENGVTPAGDSYEYRANDMSVMDVNGDGEYEFILKWDPSNSKDVSQKGYTGNTLIDCYLLDGTLLWRIDCGVNIRSGAHYTQFMCYDFDGDGKGEIAFKTAPGSKVQYFAEDGTVSKESYITLPAEDVKKGVTHEDNYVCTPDSYRQHVIEMFENWHEHSEVKAGNWPKTLEECFGIPVKYDYPLSKEDASKLADYFLTDFAKSRSEKNELDKFEGFIFEGPEYLSIFSGNGEELETIPFPFPRGDDGLMWGDYAWNRIEPCNRVDRFLAGVGYFDGVTPSLVICRGYYTRACIASYRFKDGKLSLEWKIDSGHVPMNNPFNNTLHEQNGSDPVYGDLACQGDHSVSFADVDQDGFMELIYGGVTVDHDGSILYSSKAPLPNGQMAKFGHGDAMHVADIDPDRPGLEIFNVFEEASHAPYGYALRKAETGEAIFGEHEAVRDLGRCMIGDIMDVRGHQCWVNTIGTFDTKGNVLKKETLGTNMPIRFLPDFSTQILDGADYLANNGTGVINDWRNGVILTPQNTATNNGTKGNPCLVADIFGDYREELILRTKDNTALRIYINTDISEHKLFTPMQDTQYRTGIAWQNNCYNQPCYPSYYYASDMEMSEVLPYMKKKPTYYLAGDSTMQSYQDQERPQFGWGEFLLDSLYPNYAVEKTSEEDIYCVSYENQFAKVKNYALGGRSTKTFSLENRLAAIGENISCGDYLFIQFGHNDSNAEKEERFVPLEKFPEALATYVKVATEKQATPVLLSPIVVSPNGLEDTHLKEVSEKILSYSKVAEKFAKENNLLFVDIASNAEEFFKDNDASEYYREDNIHLNEKGARLYAKLFQENFSKLTN